MAISGFKQDGRRFAADAVGRGAAVVVAEGADPLPGSATPRIIVPSSREALARLADAYHGHPSRAAHRGRDHRHERQDHHVAARGGPAGRGRAAHRRHRHDPVSRRRPGGDGQPDHARGPRAAVAAGAHGARRRRRRRDGGLLARPGALPRGRHRVRRGGLHQPDPGPPRLPPDARGLPRRQGAALHPAGGQPQALPRRGGEHGRSGGRGHAAGGGRRSAGAADHLRAARAGRAAAAPLGVRHGRHPPRGRVVQAGPSRSCRPWSASTT